MWKINSGIVKMEQLSVECQFASHRRPCSTPPSRLWDVLPAPEDGVHLKFEVKKCIYNKNEKYIVINIVLSTIVWLHAAQCLRLWRMWWWRWALHLYPLRVENIISWLVNQYSFIRIIMAQLPCGFTRSKQRTILDWRMHIPSKDNFNKVNLILQRWLRVYNKAISLWLFGECCSQHCIEVWVNVADVSLRDSYVFAWITQTFSWIWKLRRMKKNWEQREKLQIFFHVEIDIE